MAEEPGYPTLITAEASSRDNMTFKKLKFSCNDFFLKTILLNFFFTPCWAQVDDRLNKSLEQRLHSIYEKHYAREVLDADWFKIVEAVQEQVYVVRAGDTLWGISKVYFADGNYWSKLWSVNKSITNPHLILVGDRISFTTGTFSQPPSIQVEKVDGEGETTNVDLTQSEAGESSESSTTQVSALEEGEESAAGSSSQGSSSSSSGAGLEEANDLPAFFKFPTTVMRRQEEQISVVPRQAIVTKTNIILTQEVLSARPTTIGKLKSVGGTRVITGESDIVVLQINENPPAEGTLLSLIDPNFDESDSGYVIKVLATVRLVRQVEGSNYEASVVSQFDAMPVNSLVATYLPASVNISSEGEVKEIPVKVLDGGKKSVWTTGDVIFLKMLGTPGSVGDILQFSNKFDHSVNSYLYSGHVKIVSTQGTFATGVVVSSQNAIQQNSVSEPLASESSFW